VWGGVVFFLEIQCIIKPCVTYPFARRAAVDDKRSVLGHVWAGDTGGVGEPGPVDCKVCRRACVRGVPLNARVRVCLVLEVPWQTGLALSLHHFESGDAIAVRGTAVAARSLLGVDAVGDGRAV
jgi:hypothetical protein